MDVTCERCGTDYEFDETLVSDRGTTVKCTQCGHLFKVFRPDAGADGHREAMWRVRRRDGSLEIVPTLRDLQRRIMQGALSPDDEISASGQPWKRLGAIAELESFFVPAGGVRVPSSSPPSRADATVPFEIARAPSDLPPAAPPPRREKRTLIGVGISPEAALAGEPQPAPPGIQKSEAAATLIGTPASVPP
ncbi:MAG: zinc-ribbon domain-containing protein, partial [Polyangiaceae bacterium]|nr:zinc-ribbon domain-containing protein [Polyangiaceae bacterium]